MGDHLEGKENLIFDEKIFASNLGSVNKKRWESGRVQASFFSLSP